jgi:hypothetical protein
MLTLDSKVGHAEIAAFAELRVNLDQADASAYRTQVNRLRDRLERFIDEHPDFELVKMLNCGSVAKGTALRTINDMDVAVYVSAAGAPENDPDLIRWMEDLLRLAYANQLNPDQFEPKNHCVTISFRGSGLDVDVVPVLYEDEPNDYGCLIAKDTGDRVRTSIPLHLEFIRTRKAAQPFHFAQIVRLVKWWVRQRKAADTSFRLKSFIVELVVAHLADNGLDCSNYPDALQRVFSYVLKSGLATPIVFSDFPSSGKPALNIQGPIRIYDPVSALNNVALRYSDGDRRAIVEAAADAMDAISYARSASTKAIAVEQWRKVFGSGFDG